MRQEEKKIAQCSKMMIILILKIAFLNFLC